MVPEQSQGLAALSDSLQNLKEKVQLEAASILPQSRYSPVFEKLRISLEDFLKPLHSLSENCVDMDRKILGLLGQFALSSQGSHFETGDRKADLQKVRETAALLKIYPVQVALYRAERKRHTNEILAQDNEAIRSTKHESSLLHYQTVDEIIRKRSPGQFPDDLPHPMEYDQPVRAEMIQKMIHRSFAVRSPAVF